MEPSLFVVTFDWSVAAAFVSAEEVAVVLDA